MHGTLTQYGIFDATFCSGLLYHMDKPKKFLETISSVTKKMLIVHTHFAPEELGANIYNLSEWAENEGLKGRWYTEFGSDNAFRDREHAYWASWDNRASFWLCKEHILDVISKCGFGMVFEQYDCLGGEIAHSMTDSEGYYKKHSRCLFVGIRTGT